MGGDHVGGVGPDIGHRPGEGGGDGEDHGDSVGEDYDHFEDCGHGGQSTEVMDRVNRRWSS